jgi:hypothetical protein
MAFTFELTSTHRDLIDGLDADRTARTGMRWWARAGVAGMGLLWLFGSLVVMLRDKPARPSWLPFVWLLLGSLITWQFIVQPRLAAWSIRRKNVAAQHVKLVFDASGISATIAGEGDFHRPWRELEVFHVAKKGIMFGFEGSPLHWLPNRVFTDAAQRDAFIEYVTQTLDQISAPDTTES